MNGVALWRRLADFPAAPPPAFPAAADPAQPDPAMVEELAYRDRLARATEASATCWFDVPGGRPVLAPIERAGITRLVESISGSTAGDKIDAMIETMAHAPDGDVVEIGAWRGRSAALLVLLARHWNIGKVLCVDPWLAAACDQGSEPAGRPAAPERMDADWAHRIFQINLAPIAGGALNFIRAPSSVAAQAYVPGLVVETEAFGRTAYEGAIAYLHVDGNHAYEQALIDARAWTPHVKPGGWIVFDDYARPSGDGPRRVGDEFLVAEAHRISLSFVIGAALFVRLKTA